MPFLFELAPKALHRRVIPAVALAAHRADETASVEFLLIVMGTILAAPVRMNQSAFGIFPSAIRLFQRLDNQFLCHPLPYSPANRLPTIQIQYSSQIKPALVGGCM